MNEQRPGDGSELDRLALELLGRTSDDLDQDERDILARVAAPTYIGLDAAERAQLHATYGERLADRVARVGGSWGFISAFALVLVLWMLINSDVLRALGITPFDAYPFIFLNLMLSMLAAIQAPIIMMSQNRQSAKDRIAARHDYEVNLRARLEILRLTQKVDKIAHTIAEQAKERRGDSAGEG